jgi:hypothetical protein
MRFLILALFLAACGPLPTPPTVAESKRVELAPLPPDPAEEKLEGNVPRGDWVEPQEANSCTAGCPAKAGILVSEERAVRDGLYRVRYRELRLTYTADRQVWQAHRELYEKRLQLADQAIQKLQPSWWDRHKVALGVIGGFVLGSALTIGVYAIAH